MSIEIVAMESIAKELYHKSCNQLSKEEYQAVKKEWTKRLMRK